MKRIFFLICLLFVLTGCNSRTKILYIPQDQNFVGNVNVDGNVTALYFFGNGSGLTDIGNGSVYDLNIDTDAGGIIITNAETLSLIGGDGISTSGVGDTVTISFTGSASGSNTTSVWNSTGNIVFLNDSTAAIEIANVYDVDGTSFFDLTGCGTSATFITIDSTGAITCSPISITESQISDLDHYTTADFMNDFSTVNNSLSLWNISSLKIYPRDLDANVGIGTNEPTESITIAGNGSITGDFRVSGNLLGDSGDSGANPLLSGWTDDGTFVRLTDATDSVGIGTAIPTEKLEVAGNIKISSEGDLIAG